MFDIDALLEQEQQIALEQLDMDVPEDMLPPELQVRFGATSRLCSIADMPLLYKEQEYTDERMN